MLKGVFGSDVGRREIGSTLEVHLERSARAARHLDATASDAVHRVTTGEGPVGEFAAEIVRLADWGAAPQSEDAR